MQTYVCVNVKMRLFDVGLMKELHIESKQVLNLCYGIYVRRIDSFKSSSGDLGVLKIFKNHASEYQTFVASIIYGETS